MMIQTERLILRSFCKEDLQDLYEYLSDEEGNPLWKDTFVYSRLKP